jgi:orsellinic acid C2-O-methyltransferase
MDKSDANRTPTQRLMELVTASWVTQAAYVAAELRLADMLADGPLSVERLADLTGANAPALGRLLRALTSIDLCRQQADGSFEMTPMGSRLAADAPESLRAWTIWWGKHLWPVWGQLLYSVRTGQSARKLLLGTDGFEHLQNDPEAAAIFNRAAAELTRLAAERIVRSYDFSGLARIVDGGGGSGQLLATILQACPATRGVLFDLPHSIEPGRERLTQAGLIERCELVAGDFFESVPPGADAYVLKSVIHDWNDERSRVILENCRRAMQPRAGRLLLMEEMLPDRLDGSPTHRAIARGDLNMLVALGAQERTEAELRTLLDSAGLAVSRVIPTGSTFSIVEAFAKA